MYFDKISDPNEWIEAGTKVDLFYTSDDNQIIKIIQNEITIDFNESTNANYRSPNNHNNKHQLKQNLPYLCEKLEVLQKIFFTS